MNFQSEDSKQTCGADLYNLRRNLQWSFGFKINGHKGKVSQKNIPNTHKLKDKWIFMNVISKPKTTKENTEKLDFVPV